MSAPSQPAFESPRTLHCANGMLYLLMALAVVGAAVWAIMVGRVQGSAQVTLIVGGCVLAMLWGGYYAALRYRVDERGIAKCLLWKKKFYSWETLRQASAQVQDERGIMICRIWLVFDGAELCVSSELLDQDAVLAFKDDLVAAGLLKQ